MGVDSYMVTSPFSAPKVRDFCFYEETVVKRGNIHATELNPAAQDPDTFDLITSEISFPAVIKLPMQVNLSTIAIKGKSMAQVLASHEEIPPILKVQYC